jgi:hypothetical protein
MEYGGLIIDYIGNKFIYFGSNGVVVFTRLQIVVIQFKSKLAPLLTIMSYVTHCINLVMQSLHINP